MNKRILAILCALALALGAVHVVRLLARRQGASHQDLLHGAGYRQCRENQAEYQEYNCPAGSSRNHSFWHPVLIICFHLFMSSFLLLNLRLRP